MHALTYMDAASRVTRAGEFSPVVQLFTFSSFLKVTDIALTIEILFSCGKSSFLV
jgi:hypothetical protein